MFLLVMHVFRKPHTHFLKPLHISEPQPCHHKAHKAYGPWKKRQPAETASLHKNVLIPKRSNSTRDKNTLPDALTALTHTLSLSVMWCPRATACCD